MQVSVFRISTGRVGTPQGSALSQKVGDSYYPRHVSERIGTCVSAMSTRHNEGLRLRASQTINLVIVIAKVGFKYQVKEKQKQKNARASESEASDPDRLHMFVVVATSNDVVCTLTPPPQHARVTVARAIEVGELEYAHESDVEGVKTRGHY